ncbi:MAG: vitamin K epoxide reductase family protein [Patescibacteria group bacterium]|jgi:uncharacterized membrane protein
MKLKSNLITILIISIAGAAFSGYLSYVNLWGNGCGKALVSCGAAPVEIFGLPNCVYGFFMFMLVAIFAIIALARKNSRPIVLTVLIFGIAGVLFAGGLSVYEWFLAPIKATTPPACFYGGIGYLLIFIFSLLGYKKSQANQIDNGMVQGTN